MIAKEGRKKKLGCRDPRATVSQVGKKSRTGKKKMSRWRRKVEILEGRDAEDSSLDAKERDVESKKARKGRK